MKITTMTTPLGKLFKRVPVTHCAAIASTAAMLAFAPAAHAVVTVSPVVSLVVPANIDGVYVNVVSGATGTSGAATAGWDLNPYGSTSLNFFTSTSLTQYVTTGTTQVSALTAGTTIGPASTFTTAGSIGLTTFAAGAWALNSTNYFGFKFTADDGFVHYGYGTLIVGAAVTTRSIGNIYFESATAVLSNPITISAVPELATWALMLGGMAAAGAVVRRRRQLQA